MIFEPAEGEEEENLLPQPPPEAFLVIGKSNTGEPLQNSDARGLLLTKERGLQENLQRSGLS